MSSLTETLIFQKLRISNHCCTSCLQVSFISVVAAISTFSWLSRNVQTLSFEYLLPPMHSIDILALMNWKASTVVRNVSCKFLKITANSRRRLMAHQSPTGTTDTGSSVVIDWLMISNLFIEILGCDGVHLATGRQAHTDLGLPLMQRWVSK